MIKLRLILTFYKSFVVASILITLLCVNLIIPYGSGIIGILFWFKIATLVLIYFYINSYKRNEYYYYLNLGISRKKLWFFVLSIDITVFILLVVLTLFTRWPTFLK